MEGRRGTLSAWMLAMGAVALVYASVGQAGATGYLAVLSLADVPAAQMKPTALALNVVAGAVALPRYAMEGHFSWRITGPLLAGSLPMAALGGALDLDDTVYMPLIGVLLLISAAALGVRVVRGRREAASERPASGIALGVVGALVGGVAGATGNGGGVFLAPVLLLSGWADVRTTAATTLTFVWVNSLGAFVGHLAGAGGPTARWTQLPDTLPWLAGIVAVGALMGATLGARVLPPRVVQGVLAVLLLVAGARALG